MNSGDRLQNLQMKKKKMKEKGERKRKLPCTAAMSS
jgi:hypothetical protein